MSVSNKDLNDFHQFALSVRQENASSSVEELVAQWRAKKERAETNEAIRQGHVEIEAGKGRPAAEVMADMKTKFNLEAGI